MKKVPEHPRVRTIAMPLLLAYIGPETILPLGSILAAIGGVALMFWGYVRGAAAWCMSRVRRTGSSSTLPTNR